MNLSPPSSPALGPAGTCELRGRSNSLADDTVRALLAPGTPAAQRRTLLAGLSGSFALALSDGQGRWLLAVDRFAIETLCWRVDGAELHHAERADALGATANLQAQALFDYLFFHCIPSPRTVHAGVQRLPPAHYLWFDQGRITVEPYWTPAFKPQSGLRFEEAKAEFLTLLERAVQRQLGADCPTAAFLSGGTDSSTVAGLLGKVSGKAPVTYSIGFDADGYDEMAFARIAAKHFGADHREYYVTPEDLVAHIPRVAAHYDQPFGNSSALPAYSCALQAKQDGFARMLAGDGGDELFGGNSRYAKQRVFGWWRQVPQPLRKGLFDPLFLSEFAKSTPGLRKAHSYVEQANDPMPHRLLAYNLLLRLGAQTVLTPAFLAQTDADAPMHHQQQVWDSVQGASELNTTLAFDWRYTLGESDLPKVRETTRLAGVSVGFPMLDDALLEFSLRLPDDFKLKGLKLRWFFKEALRGFLPDEILTKKKQGFGLPFGVWTLRHAALRELARDSVQGLVARGVVRPEFAKALFDELLPQVPGYYGEMIWILMMLEQWLRAKAPNWKI
ncbi:asparagine synthetase B [Inhella sp.]|uniref:asparagine synthetase B family protein n=1 Tax=Inhella sp. TaxID=1921806 RepID=UPI0035B17AFA